MEENISFNPQNQSKRETVDMLQKKQQLSKYLIFYLRHWRLIETWEQSVPVTGVGRNYFLEEQRVTWFTVLRKTSEFSKNTISEKLIHFEIWEKSCKMNVHRNTVSSLNSYSVCKEKICWLWSRSPLCRWILSIFSPDYRFQTCYSEINPL